MPSLYGQADRRRQDRLYLPFRRMLQASFMSAVSSAASAGEPLINRMKTVVSHQKCFIRKSSHYTASIPAAIGSRTPTTMQQQTLASKRCNVFLGFWRPSLLSFPSPPLQRPSLPRRALLDRRRGSGATRRPRGSKPVAQLRKRPRERLREEEAIKMAGPTARSETTGLEVPGRCHRGRWAGAGL